jgi:hypothetical protein
LKVQAQRAGRVGELELGVIPADQILEGMSRLPRMGIFGMSLPGFCLGPRVRARATAERARAGRVFGDRIARVGPSRIELADRTLAVAAGARIAHPSWSPDGNTLVFTYWPPALQLADDASDDYEGSVLAQLTLEGTFREQGAANARRPRYTPSGFIFEAGKLDDPQLFVVASEGGMACRLICDAMMAKDRAWLADSWLAFVSTRPYLEPPRAQIWITSLDDTRCTAPFWFPAQDPQRDYEALFFE